jgi:hypothetical protein
MDNFFTDWSPSLFKSHDYLKLQRLQWDELFLQFEALYFFTSRRDVDWFLFIDHYIVLKGKRVDLWRAVKN